MPKCLVSSFGVILPLEESDFSFKAIVLQVHEDLPVVALKPELIDLEDDLTFEGPDSLKSCIGVVDKVSDKLGVTVRFSKGVTKLVSVKDLETSENIQTNYTIGRLVRVAHNTAQRLSLKRAVVVAVDPNSVKKD